MQFAHPLRHDVGLDARCVVSLVDVVQNRGFHIIGSGAAQRRRCEGAPLSHLMRAFLIVIPQIGHAGLRVGDFQRRRIAAGNRGGGLYCGGLHGTQGDFDSLTAGWRTGKHIGRLVQHHISEADGDVLPGVRTR